MSRFFTQEGLKCPYCDEKFPTHRALRVHVGAKHREKTDDFMDEYFGGRWIEADFVALMLQSAMGEITEEYIQRCGNDVGCPITKIHEDFAPYQIAVKVKQDEVKELLRSDIIWTCTSCLACDEKCPVEMSPHEIITIIKNLSARIGYHFPREYSELDKNVLKTGVIQTPKTVPTRTGGQMTRKNLGLPEAQAPRDMTKFSQALAKLSETRVLL
jgi:heterodisulfide reductase subunit C